MNEDLKFTIVDLTKIPELEFLKIQEKLLNFILTKKMEQGMIVFSGQDNPTIH